MQKIITQNSKQTEELAKLLAMEIRGGEIICLSGDLGAGKTTFAQGLLEGLGVEGPYTSPTFAIMKEYEVNLKFQISNLKLLKVYHIDTYRVEERDILELGWKDFSGKKNAVTIVEWAERIKDIVPAGALWIHFSWKNENEREIRIHSQENS
ncbi:MAG: hypothetical protein UY41_C0043G0004 [Candidatus Moranbacteria bacterium GW2011_GWE1_49_15]|nr:MAG: hypothetical protein UX75_C0009G0002 [Candidatus Moranbacteria bacterium GW2011_GWE2_47_10]KKW05682.1 MAG: hypothetical protein UY41_C0043G0004 [Candidatus Moranbacteria bacterium GW2011_GWE1_49_15]HBP01167.1 tRNA (adenosine(37)-N6)-threonylcarbamoyltransferase complex ATPase subunit type 1 TsaE [Candidatus Moranbacteria bacterium]